MFPVKQECFVPCTGTSAAAEATAGLSRTLLSQIGKSTPAAPQGKKCLKAPADFTSRWAYASGTAGVPGKESSAESMAAIYVRTAAAERRIEAMARDASRTPRNVMDRFSMPAHRPRPHRGVHRGRKIIAVAEGVRSNSPRTPCNAKPPCATSPPPVMPKWTRFFSGYFNDPMACRWADADSDAGSPGEQDASMAAMSVRTSAFEALKEAMLVDAPANRATSPSPLAPQASKAVTDPTSPDPHRISTGPPLLQHKSKTPKPSLLLALESKDAGKVLAALRESPESAKELFWDHGVEPPLCCAVRLQCSVAILKLLLEFGADPKDADVRGRIPCQILGKPSPPRMCSRTGPAMPILFADAGQKPSRYLLAKQIAHERVPWRPLSTEEVRLDAYNTWCEEVWDLLTSQTHSVH